MTETLPRARGSEPGEFDWILMDPTQPSARGGEPLANSFRSVLDETLPPRRTQAPHDQRGRTTGRGCPVPRRSADVPRWPDSRVFRHVESKITAPGTGGKRLPRDANLGDDRATGSGHRARSSTGGCNDSETGLKTSRKPRGGCKGTSKTDPPDLVAPADPAEPFASEDLEPPPLRTSSTRMTPKRYENSASESSSA